MKKILILMILLSAAGCRLSDEPGAKKALKDQGYTDVKIESRWTGCSDDDTYITGFKAKTSSGAFVTGVVCAGLLKGSTIRTD